MKQKENDGSLTNFYLCKNRRYRLSWILTIDGEKIILRTPIPFSEISFFTESYIYKFQREPDERDKDCVIFIERVPISKGHLDFIKSIKTSKQFFGYNYKYSEEDLSLDLDVGDFPRHEELWERVKKKKEFLDKLKNDKINK